MKFFITILFFCIAVISHAQDTLPDNFSSEPGMDDSFLPDSTLLGFTNKAEAENKQDSAYQGKWVEYLDKNGNIVPDTDAPFYRLTVYKGGMPIGIQRTYLSNDTLVMLTTYKRGMKNGIEVKYYNDGVMKWSAHYTNDKLNGIVKCYNKVGKAISKAMYYNDNQIWITKVR